MSARVHGKWYVTNNCSLPAGRVKRRIPSTMDHSISPKLSVTDMTHEEHSMLRAYSTINNQSWYIQQSQPRWAIESRDIWEGIQLSAQNVRLLSLLMCKKMPGIKKRLGCKVCLFPRLYQWSPYICIGHTLTYMHVLYTDTRMSYIYHKES